MVPHLDDVRLFFEVAKAGTITAAARRLDLPKSTVSRRLIQFEESLGIKLLHKTTRKITLTALGTSYLERCERVVREVEEAGSYLESVTTKAAGELRVTMPTDFAIHWLADFLVAFARRHPDVQLSLDLTGRRLDLVGERFDVALRVGALTGSDTVARKLFGFTWQLYASPAYLREAGRPAGAAGRSCRAPLRAARGLCAPAPRAHARERSKSRARRDPGDDRLQLARRVARHGRGGRRHRHDAAAHGAGISR